MKNKILIVDDEEDVRDVIAIALADGPVNGQRSAHCEMDQEGQQASIPHTKGVCLCHGQPVFCIAGADHIPQ